MLFVEESPGNLAHAWCADQRMLLGQIAVDGKSNEITAVLKLPELLALNGCIATADALKCQRAIAAKAASANKCVSTPTNPSSRIRPQKSLFCAAEALVSI